MQSHVPPTDVAIAPVTVQDFAMLRELAGAIWRQHYTGIISAAQIEHMLAGRFTDAALREHLQATDRWLELLRVSGAPVGYCACELTALSRDGDGSGGGPPAMKLGQLYVLESHRGTGLGRFMLGHVERRARNLGRGTLWLQVNKRNPGAISFYKAAGFTIAREAVFDIGSGFVMDDYIMEKRLGVE
jgi:GNAT superfamily N-acetyltransferase